MLVKVKPVHFVRLRPSNEYNVKPVYFKDEVTVEKNDVMLWREEGKRSLRRTC